MLPIANAILAKLIVTIVRNNVFNDLIYFFVSKRIEKLIKINNGNIIFNFVISEIFETKIIIKDINTKIGKMG